MPDETVNEKLRDRIIRHAVYVERYKSGVVKRMLEALAEGEDALRRQLAERLDRLAERGFDTGPASTASTARLEQMIRAIEQLRAEQLGALAESLPPADVDAAAPRASASTVGGKLSEELADFAQQEAAWNAAVLAQSIPQPIVVRLDLITPSSAQVYAAAMSRPFQGRLLREFYQGLVAADQQRLRRTIREGYLTGRTTQQIVRDVFGSRSQGGRNGALFQSRRNAETVVRTAVQHIASMARLRAGRQNSRVIKGWKHVSTLDGRTSPICVLADGKVYQADDPAIRWPPLHPNCRSTLIPLTKSWKELGVDRDEAPPGTRASMSGQVPADTTYGDWLRRQSAGVQDEVLGKTRADAFRRGNLPIERFIDDKGRWYTLDELRKADKLPPD